MPRYYVVVILPIMAVCTLWFVVIHPIIKHDGFRYYKLYKQDYATTIVVVNRKLTPFECFNLQIQRNDGSECRRIP